MCDQTLKRATHPSSKIYTCLWKSSPDYPSVFPDAFQIRHTEAPSWGGWSFWQLLRAARSAYTHLFIDPGQINVVSRPSSRHSLAQHTPTTSTKLILVTGVTGFPLLLSREHSLLNELFCARWTKKCNWNQHHCQIQTTISPPQTLKDKKNLSFPLCHTKWPQNTEKLLLIVIETQTHDNKFLNLTLQHLEKVLVLLWNYSAARNKSLVSFGLFSWHQ